MFPEDGLHRPKHFVQFCLIYMINPLNAELNPICYLLALLGAHHFLHVSRIRVKKTLVVIDGLWPYSCTFAKLLFAVPSYPSVFWLVGNFPSGIVASYSFHCCITEFLCFWQLALSIVVEVFPQPFYGYCSFKDF